MLQLVGIVDLKMLQEFFTVLTPWTPNQSKNIHSLLYFIFLIYWGVVLLKLSPADHKQTHSRTILLLKCTDQSYFPSHSYYFQFL